MQSIPLFSGSQGAATSENAKVQQKREAEEIGVFSSPGSPSAQQALRNFQDSLFFA